MESTVDTVTVGRAAEKTQYIEYQRRTKRNTHMVHVYIVQVMVHSEVFMHNQSSISFMPQANSCTCTML